MACFKLVQNVYLKIACFLYFLSKSFYYSFNFSRELGRRAGSSYFIPLNVGKLNSKDKKCPGWVAITGQKNCKEVQF